MDAVSAAFQGDLHIVVDDQGNAVPVAEFPDLHRLRDERLGLQLLFPELDHGHAALQRVFDLLQ